MMFLSSRGRLILKVVIVFSFVALAFHLAVAEVAAAVSDDPPTCGTYYEPVIGQHLKDTLFFCKTTSERSFNCLINGGGSISYGACLAAGGEVSWIGEIAETSDYDADSCRRVDSIYQVLDDREGNFTYIAILGSCMDFGTFFNQAILWGSVVGAGIALARFGIGALQYAWSTGDPTKLEAARETILYAVVGMLIIALSYLIVRLGSSFVPESWRIWFGV